MAKPRAFSTLNCMILLAASAILTYAAPLPALAQALKKDCGAVAPLLQSAWPQTDFDLCTASLDEILSGGPGKDGIPPIDRPKFIPVAQESTLVPTEPVISVRIGDHARAYPLRILTWHEIANDVLGGKPIAVTYCPLCNAAIVFDRRLDGAVLDFGTTGNLRNSDLVMYDRQSESWWQQFSGTGLFGLHAGRELKRLASRLESWEAFKKRHPEGTVLVPNSVHARRYGTNPYVGYDSAPLPFLYRGEVPKGIAPLARVVVVGNQAWSLDYLKKRNPLKIDNLVIVWQPGQNSALDTREIANGRDVGTVTVQERQGGGLVDIPYEVTFAFVFHAFQPKGKLVF